VKDRESYGTPYSLGEARLAAKDVRNAYHRELMEWLVSQIDAMMCGDLFEPEDAAAERSTCVLAARHDGDHKDADGRWWRSGRWVDVDGDPVRAVAERVLANAGRDGLPPHTRLDAEALARWAIGKTAPVPGTST
jgi:hypothetical protein